jgi:hypothetical protein
MTPVQLRELMRRCRRHAAAVLVVLTLAGAIAVHHSSLAMGDKHHDMGMATVAELCLGVFTAVSAAAAAVALGLLVLRRWHPPIALVPVAAVPARRPPRARARAGPTFLCVLRC